jgi:hypothetical protein
MSYGVATVTVPKMEELVAVAVKGEKIACNVAIGEQSAKTDITVLDKNGIIAARDSTILDKNAIIAALDATVVEMKSAIAYKERANTEQNDTITVLTSDLATCTIDLETRRKARLDLATKDKDGFVGPNEDASADTTTTTTTLATTEPTDAGTATSASKSGSAMAVGIALTCVVLVLLVLGGVVYKMGQASAAADAAANHGGGQPPAVYNDAFAPAAATIAIPYAAGATMANATYAEAANEAANGGDQAFYVEPCSVQPGVYDTAARQQQEAAYEDIAEC